MKQLKEEFTFQYQNKTIQVRLCGEVYCAMGKVAKPLIVAIDGAIYLRETAQLLGFVNIKDITK